MYEETALSGQFFPVCASVVKTYSLLRSPALLVNVATSLPRFSKAHFRDDAPERIVRIWKTG